MRTDIQAKGYRAVETKQNTIGETTENNTNLLTAFIQNSIERKNELQTAAEKIIESYSPDEQVFARGFVKELSKYTFCLEQWIRIEVVNFYRKNNDAAIYDLKNILYDIRDMKEHFNNVRVKFNLEDNVSKDNFNRYLFTLQSKAERLINYIELESKQNAEVAMSEKYEIENQTAPSIEELLSTTYKITTAGNFQKIVPYYYCPEHDYSMGESGECKVCKKQLVKGTNIKDIDAFVVPFIKDIRKKVALENWTKNDVRFVEKVIEESTRDDILNAAITVRNEMRAIMNSWESDEPYEYNGGQSPEEFEEHEEMLRDISAKQAENCFEAEKFWYKDATTKTKENCNPERIAPLNDSDYLRTIRDKLMSTAQPADNSKHKWKRNLTLQDLVNMLNYSEKTIRKKIKITPTWREAIQKDEIHSGKWKIISGKIDTLKKR